MTIDAAIPGIDRAIENCQRKNLYEQSSTAFEFEDGQWKDLGRGLARLVTDGPVECCTVASFEFEQDGVSDGCLRHRVVHDSRYCVLKLNSGRDTCWAWTIRQVCSSTHESVEKHLALRFSKAEHARAFEHVYNHAKEINARVGGYKDDHITLHQTASRIFVYSENAWVDRGTGTSKLLKHTPTGRFRFVFFSDQGGKIITSHYVEHDKKNCNIKANSNSRICWNWIGEDVSGESCRLVRVALKLPDARNASLFKVKFQCAKEASSVALGFVGESQLFGQRGMFCKIENGEWTNFGWGTVSILKHELREVVRFVFRKDKKGDLKANHYVFQHPEMCELKKHATTEDCWVWSAIDLSKFEPRRERYALKFESSSQAACFSDVFQTGKTGSVSIGAVFTDFFSEENAITVHQNAPDNLPNERSIDLTIRRSGEENKQRCFKLYDGKNARRLTIGRSAECEICIASSAVSNTHAYISLGEERDEGDGPLLIVQDESINGTTLRVPGQEEVHLGKGDRCKVPTGTSVWIPSLCKGTERNSQVRLLLDVGGLLSFAMVDWVHPPSDQTPNADPPLRTEFLASKLEPQDDRDYRSKSVSRLPEIEGAEELSPSTSTNSSSSTDGDEKRQARAIANALDAAASAHGEKAASLAFPAKMELDQERPFYQTNCPEASTQNEDSEQRVPAAVKMQVESDSTAINQKILGQAMVHELIRDVYAMKNPAKLPEMERLFERYVGSEVQLYLSVCKKYGVEPVFDLNPPAQPSRVSAARKILAAAEASMVGELCVPRQAASVYAEAAAEPPPRSRSRSRQSRPRQEPTHDWHQGRANHVPRNSLPAFASLPTLALRPSAAEIHGVSSTQDRERKRGFSKPLVDDSGSCYRSEPSGSCYGHRRVHGHSGPPALRSRSRPPEKRKRSTSPRSRSSRSCPPENRQPPRQSDQRTDNRGRSWTVHAPSELVNEARQVTANGGRTVGGKGRAENGHLRYGHSPAHSPPRGDRAERSHIRRPPPPPPPPAPSRRESAFRSRPAR